MEVSVENTGGLARRMTVQVPAERVDQEVESRLQSMTRTVRLDGFRAGKVPLKVVEQKFGKQVRLEVIGQVVSSTMQEAFAQESLRPAGDPSIEPKESVPGEPLEYVATFEIFPELNAEISYGFSVVRPTAAITDEDVNAMLDTLRRQRATWKTAGRAAQSGDQATIDFTGTVDGKPFSGNTAENMPIVLGSGSMIKGFEEQLEGLSAGDEKTLNITFPEDYPSSEVAGKPAEFAVKVHDVSEMVLPELDDSFAEGFGITSGGMTGLKAEVTGNMQRELSGLVASKLKIQVFDGLLEKNPVDVPQGMVDTEVQQLREQHALQGQSDEVLRANAEKRLKLGVVVSELAKQNQIQVDPDRVRTMVETIAASYEKPEEVIQWYYGNQEMLANVQSSVMEEQAVEWVIEHSGVEVKDQKMSFNELVEEARRAQG
ncbi:MAG: trigger factor [Gammaproteobacteria bacterium]|nr:trigger factor [Gammaproteobacteria bacterium]